MKDNIFTKKEDSLFKETILDPVNLKIENIDINDNELINSKDNSNKDDNNYYDDIYFQSLKDLNINEDNVDTPSFIADKDKLKQLKRLEKSGLNPDYLDSAEKLETYENIAEKNQSFYNKVWNSASKASVIAYKSFLNNLYQIPRDIKSIISDDETSKYNDSFLRDLNQTMQDIDNEYPVYKKPNNSLKNEIVNMTWDIAPQIGFTLGSAASIVASEIALAAITAATGGTSSSTTIPAAFLIASKNLKNTYLGLKNLKNLNLIGKNLKNLSKTSTTALLKSSIYNHITSSAEAAIEANSIYDELYSELYKKYSVNGNKYEAIRLAEKEAREGATKVYWANKALLSLTNIPEIALFSKPLKSILNKVSPSFLNPYVSVDKLGKKLIVKNKSLAKRIAKSVLLNNVSESFEEFEQTVFTNTIKQHYLLKDSKEGKYSTLNYLTDIFNNQQKTLLSKEGLESLYSGFVVGSLMKGGSKIAEYTPFLNKLTTPSESKILQKEVENFNNILDENNITYGELLKKQLNYLNIINNIEVEKSNSALNNDSFKIIKDLEELQKVSLIRMLSETGLNNHFFDKMLFIDEIIKNKIITDENAEYYGIKDEKAIKKTIDKLKILSENYERYNEIFDNTFSKNPKFNLENYKSYQNAKHTVIENLVLADIDFNRAAELQEKIKNNLLLEDISFFESLFDESKRKQQIELLKQQIESISSIKEEDRKNLEKENIYLLEEKNQREDKIEKLNFLENFNEIFSEKDKIEKHKLENLLNILNLDKNYLKDELKQEILDIFSLVKNGNNLKNSFNLLFTNPTKFEKFSKYLENIKVIEDINLDTSDDDFNKILLKIHNLVNYDLTEINDIKNEINNNSNLSEEDKKDLLDKLDKDFANYKKNQNSQPASTETTNLISILDSNYYEDKNTNELYYKDNNKYVLVDKSNFENYTNKEIVVEYLITEYTNKLYSLLQITEENGDLKSNIINIGETKSFKDLIQNLEMILLTDTLDKNLYTDVEEIINNLNKLFTIRHSKLPNVVDNLKKKRKEKTPQASTKVQSSAAGVKPVEEKKEGREDDIDSLLADIAKGEVKTATEDDVAEIDLDEENDEELEYFKNYINKTIYSNNDKKRVEIIISNNDLNLIIKELINLINKNRKNNKNIVNNYYYLALLNILNRINENNFETILIDLYDFLQKTDYTENKKITDNNDFEILIEKLLENVELKVENVEEDLEKSENYNFISIFSDKINQLFGSISNFFKKQSLTPFKTITQNTDNYNNLKLQLLKRITYTDENINFKNFLDSTELDGFIKSNFRLEFRKPNENDKKLKSIKSLTEFNDKTLNPVIIVVQELIDNNWVDYRDPSNNEIVFAFFKNNLNNTKNILEYAQKLALLNLHSYLRENKDKIYSETEINEMYVEFEKLYLQNISDLENMRYDITLNNNKYHSNIEEISEGSFDETHITLNDSSKNDIIFESLNFNDLNKSIFANDVQIKSEGKLINAGNVVVKTLSITENSEHKVERTSFTHYLINLINRNDKDLVLKLKLLFPKIKKAFKNQNILSYNLYTVFDSIYNEKTKLNQLIIVKNKPNTVGKYDRYIYIKNNTSDTVIINGINYKVIKNNIELLGVLFLNNIKVNSDDLEKLLSPIKFNLDVKNYNSNNPEIRDFYRNVANKFTYFVFDSVYLDGELQKTPLNRYLTFSKPVLLPEDNNIKNNINLENNDFNIDLQSQIINYFKDKKLKIDKINLLEYLFNILNYENLFENKLQIKYFDNNNQPSDKKIKAFYNPTDSIIYISLDFFESKDINLIASILIEEILHHITTNIADKEFNEKILDLTEKFKKLIDNDSSSKNIDKIKSIFYKYIYNQTENKKIHEFIGQLLGGRKYGTVSFYELSVKYKIENSSIFEIFSDFVTNLLEKYFPNIFTEEKNFKNELLKLLSEQVLKTIEKFDKKVIKDTDEKTFESKQTTNQVETTAKTLDEKKADIERRRQELEKKYEETDNRHKEELLKAGVDLGKYDSIRFNDIIFNIEEQGNSENYSKNVEEIAKRHYEEWWALNREKQEIEADADKLSFSDYDFSQKESILSRLKKAISSVYQNNRQALEDGFVEWASVEREVAEAGGDKYSAHGMGKTTIASAFNDLITLFEKGINPFRGQGALDVATLAGGNSAGTTAGGAYMDGAFTLIANRNHQGAITDINQVGGIIVNEGIATNEVLSVLRELFPNLTIESTSNSKSLVEQLNAKYDAELAALEGKPTLQSEVEATAKTLEEKKAELERLEKEKQEELQPLIEEKEKIEKEIEELDKLLTNKKDEKLSNIIDETVSKKDIENIANEENINQEDVKEKIKDTVKSVIDNKSFLNNIGNTLKKVVNKILKKFLIIGVLFSTYNLNSSFVTYNYTKTNESKIEISKTDISFKKLTNDGKKAYLSEINNKKPFVLVDKPTATVYIYNSSGVLIKDFPCILGKNIGDELNTADTNSEIPTNAYTTPGRYTLSSNVSSEYKNTYHNRILKLNNSNGLAIHEIYPEELEKRTNAINSKTIDDNRLSWGCINIISENYDKYIAPYITDNSVIIITRDFQENDLVKNTKNENQSKPNNNNSEASLIPLLGIALLLKKKKENGENISEEITTNLELLKNRLKEIEKQISEINTKYDAQISKLEQEIANLENTQPTNNNTVDNNSNTTKKRKLKETNLEDIKDLSLKSNPEEEETQEAIDFLYNNINKHKILSSFTADVIEVLMAKNDFNWVFFLENKLNINSIKNNLKILLTERNQNTDDENIENYTYHLIHNDKIFEDYWDYWLANNKYLKEIKINDDYYIDIDVSSLNDDNDVLEDSESTNTEEAPNQFKPEEITKGSFDISPNSLSPSDSANSKIKFLVSILEKRDKNNNIIRNEYGSFLFENPVRSWAIIIKVLNGAIDWNDMIFKIEQNKKIYSILNSLYDKIKNISSLEISPTLPISKYKTIVHYATKIFNSFSNRISTPYFTFIKKSDGTYIEVNELENNRDYFLQYFKNKENEIKLFLNEDSDLWTTYKNNLIIKLESLEKLLSDKKMLDAFYAEKNYDFIYNFYNNFGIILLSKDYLNIMSKNDKNNYLKLLIEMNNHILQNYKLDSKITYYSFINDIIYSKNEKLNQSGRFNNILDIISKYSELYVRTSGTNAEKEKIYLMSLSNHFLNTIKMLNKFIDKNDLSKFENLFNKVGFEFLNPENNYFILASKTISDLFNGFKINYGFYGGLVEKTKEDEDKTLKSTKNLDVKDWIILNFNTLLKFNKMEILRAETSSSSYFWNTSDNSKKLKNYTELALYDNEQIFVNQFKKYFISNVLNYISLYNDELNDKNLEKIINNLNNSSMFNFIKDVEFLKKIIKDIYENKNAYLKNNYSELILSFYNIAENNSDSKLDLNLLEELKNILANKYKEELYSLLDVFKDNNFTADKIDQEILNDFLNLKEEDLNLNLADLYKKYGANSNISKIIKLFLTEYLIRNAEETILFNGDLMYFKNLHKRLKPNISTGSQLMSEDFIHKSINSDNFGNFSKIFGFVGDISQNTFKSFVASEVEITESNSDYATIIKDATNVILKLFPKNLENLLNRLKSYLKITIADGQGWIQLDKYKEMLLKAGNWGDNEEKVYQYLLAKYRVFIYNLKSLPENEQKNITKNYKIYENINPYGNNDKFNFNSDLEFIESMDDYFKNNPNSVTAFPPIKFLAKGILKIKNKKSTAPLLDKFSLMPLLPEMAINSPMEKIMVKMLENNYAYFKIKSGTKLFDFGLTNVFGENIDDIYENYDVSLDIKEENTHDVPSFMLKEQILTSGKVKLSNLLGTQFRKLIYAYQYDTGKPIITELKDNLDAFKNIIDDLLDNAFIELLDDLGLKISNNKIEINNLPNFIKNIDKYFENYEVYNETFIDLDEEDYKVFIDFKKAFNTLKNKLDKKEHNINIDNSFKLNENNDNFLTPLDTLLNRNEINNLLRGLINTKLIDQKINGTASILVSSLGFNKFNKPENISKKHWGVNGLRFYKIVKDGKKVLKAECKVSLNKNYKKLLNLTNPLTGIEIGNLGTLNSLLLEIKKAKIYHYYSSEYNLSEEDKAYYNNLLNWYKLNLENSLTIIGYRIPTQGYNSQEVLEIVEFLPEYSGNVLIPYPEIVIKSGSDFDIDKIYTIMANLSKDGKYIYESQKNDLLNHIKSIENKLISQTAEIILNVDNYLNLILPNSTDLISPAVERILEKLNITHNETNTNANSLTKKTFKMLKSGFTGFENLTLLTNSLKFKTMFTGMKLLGVFAVNNTFATLLEKHNGILNSTYMSKNGQLRKYINILGHTNRSGDKILLSKSTDQNGIMKLDVISQFINYTVDIASDDTLGYLNIISDNIGIVNYMILNNFTVERIFSIISQPIIYKYELEDNKINLVYNYIKNLIFLLEEEKSNSNILNDLRLILTNYFNSENFLKKDKNIEDVFYEILNTIKNDTNIDFLSLEELENMIIPLTILNKNDLTNIIYKKDKEDRINFLKNQLLILSNYVLFKEQSEILLKLQTYINNDTNPYKSIFEISIKDKLYNEILDSEFFDFNFLNEIINNSIISKFIKNNEFKKIMSVFFNIIYEEQTLNKFSKFLSENLLKRISKNKKEKLYKLLENDFLEAIIKSFGKIDDVNFSDYVENLLNNEDFKNSFTYLKNKIKKLNNDNYNEFMNKFLILPSDNERYNVGYKPVNKNDISETNIDVLIYEELINNNALNENDKNILKNLAYIGFYQSGYNKSQISFLEVIPSSILENLIKNSLNKYQNLTEYEKNIFINDFFELFKKYNPKYFPKKDESEVSNFKNWRGKNYKINTDYDIYYLPTDSQELDYFFEKLLKNKIIEEC